MNHLQIITGEVTKEKMNSLLASYLADTKISPLVKYLNFKAMEFIIKNALANKSFRDEVKADYLEKVNGALSHTEVMGVSIKTVSQVKKNELSKTYLYSDKVSQLEKECELLQQELKMKQDNLKGQKLLEINSGTAQEISSKETTALDEFNLTVTFKN